METHTGKSLSYGLTSTGILVQVVRAAPIDSEWNQAVEAIRENSERLIGLVVFAPQWEGPSANQRRVIAELLSSLPSAFRGVVVLSKSTVGRLILTAMTWLTRTNVNIRLFALGDLDRALNALRLDGRQSLEVRTLLAELHPR